MADGDPPRFGEEPLAQTVAAAGVLRRIAGQLLSLEHPHPTVDTMLAQLREWESELAGAVSAGANPRIGPGADSQRVYLSHAFDIGTFNPCFPEYQFDRSTPGRRRAGSPSRSCTRARRASCTAAFSPCSSTA